MEKKASGKDSARLNARGFEEIEGEYYGLNHVSSPVTNEVTIRIVLMLIIMADWASYLADINEVFLLGNFENREELFLEILKRFESEYNKIMVPRMKCTIYRLKQVTRTFLKLLLMAMRYMGFEKSKANPCLYWKMTDTDLLLKFP